MITQNLVWLDTKRYDEFVEGLLALCNQVGYYVNDVTVRQDDVRGPKIEIELAQAPRQEEAK